MRMRWWVWSRYRKERGLEEDDKWGSGKFRIQFLINLVQYLYSLNNSIHLLWRNHYRKEGMHTVESNLLLMLFFTLRQPHLLIFRLWNVVPHKQLQRDSIIQFGIIQSGKIHLALQCIWCLVFQFHLLSFWYLLSCKNRYRWFIVKETNVV